MRCVRIYQVDAFTRSIFSGNPAGVVPEADGLSAAQMQAIAREMNCSETAFVMRPSRPDADLRIRYFTPATEVPSCGHATVAAHYVRARTMRESLPFHSRTETAAGVLDVQTIRDGDDLVVCMKQAAPTFGRIIDGEALQSLVAALGVESTDLRENVPCQVVSTGHSKVIIPLAHESVLSRIRPHYDALTEISAAIGCNGYFPFALVKDASAATRGRMFAPAIGIPEDPVTGNANGPMGAYLVQYGLLPHDGTCLRFRAEQGMHVGRPGFMDVAVDIRGSRPDAVRIYGTAVIVFEAECRLNGVSSSSA